MLGGLARSLTPSPSKGLEPGVESPGEGNPPIPLPVPAEKALPTLAQLPCLAKSRSPQHVGLGAKSLATSNPTPNRRPVFLGKRPATPASPDEKVLRKAEKDTSVERLQIGKIGTQIEMVAKHKDEKPATAVAKGSAVVYEYINGDRFVINGNHPNRDQNPGNIIAGELATKHGAIGKDGRFAVFPTSEAGWSAMKDLIVNKYGNLSVNDMISKYAPPNENNTKGYQATVTRLAGVKGDVKISSLTDRQIGTLMNVMARDVEGWRGDKYVP